MANKHAAHPALCRWTVRGAGWNRSGCLDARSVCCSSGRCGLLCVGALGGKSCGLLVTGLHWGEVCTRGTAVRGVWRLGILVVHLRDGSRVGGSYHVVPMSPSWDHLPVDSVVAVVSSPDPSGDVSISGRLLVDLACLLLLRNCGRQRALCCGGLGGSQAQ